MQRCGNSKKILTQGQVNGHKVLVLRKLYSSETEDQIYITVLEQYINSCENNMKPEIKYSVNSVDPDQLPSGSTLFSVQQVSS